MNKMKEFVKRQKDEFQATQRHLLLKQIHQTNSVDLGKDCDDAFLQEVMEALVGNTSVTKLTIKGHNLVEGSSIDQVAGMCTKNKHLTTLRLINCSLTDDGTMSLFGALAHNHTIRHLNLEQNELSSSDGIVMMLQHNKVLEDIDLSSNLFNDDALFGIACGLPLAPELRSLCLAHNAVSDHVAMKFATTIEKALEDIPHFHTLDFGKDSTIRPETKRYLEALIGSRPKPSKFKAIASQVMRSDGTSSPTKKDPLQSPSSARSPIASEREVYLEDGEEEEEEEEEAQNVSPSKSNESLDAEAAHSQRTQEMNVDEEKRMVQETQEVLEKHEHFTTEEEAAAGSAVVKPVPPAVASEHSEAASAAAVAVPPSASREDHTERERRLQAELEQAKQKIATLERANQKLMKEKQAVTRSSQNATKEIQNLHSQLEEAQREALSERSAREAAEKEIGALTETLEASNVLAKEAASARDKAEVELSQIKESTEEMQKDHIAELQTIDEQFQAMQRQLDEADGRLASMAEQRDSKIAETAVLEKALVGHVSKVVELQAALDALAASQLATTATVTASSESSPVKAAGSSSTAASVTDSSAGTDLSLLDWEQRRLRRDARKDQLRFQKALRDGTAKKPNSSFGSAGSFANNGSGGSANNGSMGAASTRSFYHVSKEKDVDPNFSPMTKQQWIDDESVECCGSCERKFSFTQRKHHCRRCGKIFCDNCCPKSKMHEGKRICTKCVNSRNRGDSLFESKGTLRASDM